MGFTFQGGGFHIPRGRDSCSNRVGFTLQGGGFHVLNGLFSFNRLDLHSIRVDKYFKRFVKDKYATKLDNFWRKVHINF